MRQIASLAAELQISGIALVALGVLGAGAAMASGVDPVRVLVPVAVGGVAAGLAQHLIGGRWIRVNALGAPRAPQDTPVEREQATLRRTLLTQVLIYLVVLAIFFVALSPTLAAVFGGVLAGVGVANLIAARWLGECERETSVTVLREVSSSPFASGRRPLYTLPRSDSTLAT